MLSQRKQLHESKRKKPLWKSVRSSLTLTVKVKVRTLFGFLPSKYYLSTHAWYFYILKKMYLNLYWTRDKVPHCLTKYISSSYVLLLLLCFIFKSCLFLIALKQFYIKIKFSCVWEKSHEAVEMSTKVTYDDGNHSPSLSVQRKHWRAFSFDVHSKWPLHFASLVLKKVTAPECEVGSCHVPLSHEDRPSLSSNVLKS